MNSQRLMTLLLMVGLAVGLNGCSDSTAPQATSGDLGNTILEGSLDPGAGTFVLKTLDVDTPHGPRVRVELIGSDLQTDPDSNTVSIMVALHSLHTEPLYSPATVWVGQVRPRDVEVRNADMVLPVYDPDGNPTGETVFGFDYSELLGEDGMLSPDETSEAKMWQFMSPDLASFTFGARAEFGMAPDMARLGGLCFNDENRNGFPDEGEMPLHHGMVTVTTPGGEIMEIMVRDDGRYGMPVTEAGLYTVFYDPMIQTFAPVSFSTPNPRQVVITANADGQLQSFMHADFGMFTDVPPGPPMVQFTDLPPDSLHYEMWNLIDAKIRHRNNLRLEVGYSGCQERHPFSLWASGGFMESDPVQINLVPVHELAEDCDMAFTGRREFGLMPLRERFLEAYGPGVLVLNVIDFNGATHQVEWRVFPDDHDEGHDGDHDEDHGGGHDDDD